MPGEAGKRHVGSIWALGVVGWPDVGVVAEGSTGGMTMQPASTARIITNASAADALNRVVFMSFDYSSRCGRRFNTARFDASVGGIMRIDG